MVASKKDAPDKFDPKDFPLEVVKILHEIIGLFDHTTPEGRPIIAEHGADLRARLERMHFGITGENIEKPSDEPVAGESGPSTPTQAAADR
jgi:hypothetical protein